MRCIKIILKGIFLLFAFCVFLLLLTNLEPFQANNVDFSHLHTTESKPPDNITVQIFYVFKYFFFNENESDVEEITEPDPIVSEEETTQYVETQPSTSIYDDDYDYPGFYGRLYIPAIDINVALYSSREQEVVDRQDSAAIFLNSGCEGLIIGDHNYDGFSRLFNLGEGVTGYIVLADGSTVNIQCTWFGYGHNAGPITDENYEPILTGYDYLMYTCYDGWKNVGVWKWTIV